MEISSTSRARCFDLALDFLGRCDGNFGYQFSSTISNLQTKVRLLQSFHLYLTNCRRKERNHETCLEQDEEEKGVISFRIQDLIIRRIQDLENFCSRFFVHSRSPGLTEIKSELTRFREAIKLFFGTDLNESRINSLLDDYWLRDPELVIDFIDSVSKTLAELLLPISALRQPSIAPVKTLEVKLVFLKSFIRFAILRGVEGNQIIDLLIHAEVVAINALRLIWWFDRFDEELPNEIELQISQLRREKINPSDPQVRVTYIHVLSTSKLSRSPDILALEKNKHLVADFVDCLLHNIMELSNICTRIPVPICEQMQDLHKGLTFLTIILRHQNKFGELCHEMKNRIGVVVCDAAIVIFSLPLNQVIEKGLARETDLAFFHLLKELELIRAEVAQIYPLASVSCSMNFLQKNLEELIQAVQTVQNDVEVSRSLLEKIEEQGNQNEKLQAFRRRVTEVAIEVDLVINRTLVARDINLMKIEAQEIYNSMSYDSETKRATESFNDHLASMPVMHSIIAYVLQLLRDRASLMTGNEDKTNQLVSNLGLLKTSIERYNEMHCHRSNDLLQLAKEIRELVNEVGDVLETYVVEKTLHENKSWFRNMPDIQCANRLRAIGENALSLNQRIDKAYKDNQGIATTLLQIDEDRRRNPIPEANQLGSYPKADRIIGFEDAANDVLKLLGVKSEAGEQSTSRAEPEIESKKLKVVTIHGMLGLGKTTLANKVLEAQETEYAFVTRILVEVKEKYDKKEVLLSILRSLKSDITDQNMEVTGFVKKVHEELKYKYLVVVDNVRSKADWEDLKDAFPEKNNGSRVLITTQDVRVSHCIQPKAAAYALRFMEPKEAEELLRMKVIGENEFPEGLKYVEESILRMCNGLPLAIVLTAGILLHHSNDLKHWNNVLDKVPLLDENVIEIDHYIRLSYRNLHHKLKPCFLYLGVFPGDVEIQASKVLQLWIAEGFIPQSTTASLEGIAESYLEELVYRNLLIVRQKTLSGKIKTFRIHDTLHEFCKKTGQAEDLFQAIDWNTNPSCSRRLYCINSNFPKYVYRLQHADKVRSLLSFGQDEASFSEDFKSSIFKPFKLLRILDISSIHIRFFNLFPTKLSNLVLLRFVAINFDLSVLPKSMCILHNLETLIVHTTAPMLKIEAYIWGMTKLRHLHTNTTTSLPECQDQSSSSRNLQTLSLQTLSAISPESLRKEVFKRTENLKKLGICGMLGNVVKDGDSDLFDCLCKLSTIENLKLHSADINSKLLGLPQPDKFPTNLKRLSLYETGLQWNIHMPIIGKLQSLEVLKLKNKAFVGVEWKTEKGGFRSLKVLFISGGTDLKNWEAKADDLPELRCLILKHIKSLEQMPSDFKHMKNLEKIDLECNNSKLVKSARDIQKSRPQIKLSVYPPEEVIAM